MSDCEQPRMMASTLADNSSRMPPASGREREQKTGCLRADAATIASAYN